MAKFFKSYLFFIQILLISLTITGIKAESGSLAVTTENPVISTEELKLLLTPLDRDELIIEADAWKNIVKSKAQEIAHTEIKILRENKTIDKLVELEGKQQELDKQIQAASGELEKANQSGDATKIRESEQTLDELKGQLQALDEKALEIATPEIKSGSAGDSIQNGTASGNDSQDSVIDTVQEAETHEKEEKIDLLKMVAQLREERTQLLDNFRAVVSELETKTDKKDAEMLAKIKDYRRYIRTISGIHVDVTDTTSAWVTVKGWLVSEQGGSRWFKNFVTFIVIIIVSWFLGKFLSHLSTKALFRTQLPVLLKDFLAKSVRWSIMIIGFIWALSALEVSIGPILALVGAAGFILAFALQDSLSNFASGLMILFFRPFDTGDAVEAGGVSGTVQSMNLVSTTIKTFDHKLMVVPNSKIWSDVITNITGVTQRRVDMEFGIGYDDDIDKAQAILEDIVASHPKVLKDPAPVIKLAKLADSSVNFICRPWTAPANYWDVYWDVTREVKKRFDAEGVGIPFPQRDVHLYVKQGDTVDSKVAAVPGLTDIRKPSVHMDGPHDDGGLDTPDEEK